ncbi:PREDICTED: zinc finger protein 385A [Pseudopodoces humilis]|uniref:zinc finger protein 385A n=1 Tax=Pseudopodoces humilis TaxID=181119 RepID=UPI0006B83790|nr:PREDICTED: zinc finger protein 385A [Pseudopodoces humilis]
MEPVPKGVLGALAKPRRPVIACSVCQIRFNSESQAAAHYQGNRHARRLKGLEAARARRGGDTGDPRTKHKTLVEARSGLGPIRAFPRGGGSAGTPPAETPERSFHCQICNVRLNSELQLKQHISSRRHRDGVAGKPNPLLGRHKKPRSPPELEQS